jgi:RNA polymerase sigma factor (sigma-70 family)
VTPLAAFAEHLPLADRIARGFARAVPVPADEIRQAARFGLWRGLTRSRGEPTLGYLKLRVRGEILDYLRSTDSLPRRFRARCTAAGTSPPMFVPLERADSLALDAPAVDALVAEHLESLEQWGAIARALPELHARDAELVRLQAQGMMQREIARRFRLTEARVSQITRRAHARLREVIHGGGAV